MNSSDIQVKQKSEGENELLEIYILVEKGDFNSIKQAAIRYKALRRFSLIPMGLIINELKQDYNNYISQETSLKLRTQPEGDGC